ncbi:hypothetical protein HK099_000505 [Clydaea vesicula]|uniref:Uncharacterized protein n=1 Tax=Clydaea vesicula TaxID=447962 RepID=A0AAD5TWK3_9FUNG|nr:hypothetical protein HK099_000505 [Clydaea vesicula]
MVEKSYLKYKPSSTFGVIASSNANTLFSDDGKFVISPMLESVGIWDWKKGTLVNTWKDNEVKAEVTCIAKFKSIFAVGYADGSIRIWNFTTNSTNTTFNGHKTSVTALCFDNSGGRLASGARDTDVVIWDITAECGLYRLKGHKDQISGLLFLPIEGLNHLVSTSKDTLLKVWDLSTQHCVETVIAHRTEVWSVASSRDGTILYTGASDSEFRVWSVDSILLKKKLEPNVEGDIETSKEDVVLKEAISLRSTLQRQSKERVSTIKVHPNGRYIAVQSMDKSVEIFKCRTQEEIKKRLARKKKRVREKITQKGNDALEDVEDQELDSVVEELVSYNLLRCSGKVRSFDFSPSLNKSRASKESSENIFTALCALSNNSVEIYSSVGNDSDGEPYNLISTLEMQGHRSDIRCLALSSNDELIASGSNNSLKIWNVNTGQCIKTMESGYALCCTFVPGNKYVIVGTKSGDLEIFDLSSSSLLESIKAHEGPLWSLEVRHDKGGLTTGSADKEVKFWDFQLLLEDNTSAKRLSLVHTRTLKMSDDVLHIKHSHDNKLLAVALLDSTVKVFYFDTLKFVLSLYGHKLPVLSMDISSDSALIATASADKTIKLWGLDFGDCHRSIFAHQDSIMSLKFVWGTHYLFSVSKDKCLKYWDGDKFEQIMKLEGHHSEIWSLVVAKFGSFVVTGSHDRSIRIWEKTDEQLFLEEEREREIEEMYEKSEIKERDGSDELPFGAGADDEAGDLILDPTKKVGDVGDEVGIAGKKTSDTLKAGEKLIEALDVWRSEIFARKEYKDSIAKGQKNVALPKKSPYILALGNPDLSAENYVMHVAERIRASDLDQALAVLPFVNVQEILQCISVWAEKVF